MACRPTWICRSNRPPWRRQQARLPALIESEREARYALAILLGRAPEGFDVSAQNLNGIVSPTVQPGLPSEVLLRQPDVAQAEANLYAAHANVDAARAAFFPSVGLTGSAGYASAAIAGLTNPGNFVWSFGVSLLQTIFDGGRLKAADDFALALQQQLIATYRKTVFTAFSNVETALGQTASDNDQLVALTEEVRASTEAFRIAELQYREGTIDILSLLTTEQQTCSPPRTRWCRPSWRGWKPMSASISNWAGAGRSRRMMRHISRSSTGGRCKSAQAFCA